MGYAGDEERFYLIPEVRKYFRVLVTYDTAAIKAVL